jgi:uncharacterized protein YjbI with pentapeptide repeats
MNDRPDDPESGAGEPKPPKIKAEDNPWYLLATLYGVPNRGDDELQAKNRAAWNRYFSAELDEKTRAQLIEEKRHPAQELTPFSLDELREVETTFAERCKASAKKPALRASNADIDFSNVKFEQDVFFGGYLFSRDSSFSSATFSGGALFDGATFSGEATFGRATFSGRATFRGVTFSAWAEFHATCFARADFDGATFSRDTHFSGATFSGGAYFAGATFSGDAYFHRATFSGSRIAYFIGATFSGIAYFIGATFSGIAHFSGATFSGVAGFAGATFQTSSSFVNAEMKDTTSFEGAIFKTEPPEFFGAKLHQGTVWRGIAWPPKPRDKDEAGPFIDAYACLKLEMDRLKKHEDELDFFALEMQSRRVLFGSWRWGLPIALYGLLSDYGRSYALPFLWLLGVAAIGAMLLVFSDALPIAKSFGLSAANTLNVFGFRKDFFEPAEIARLPAWLDVMSAAQTILGTILLFLFGLGIRNKFRMK